jgi:hypothetical protein
MGQYHSTETPAEVRARFKARGRAQRVKVDLPVTLNTAFAETSARATWI